MDETTRKLLCEQLDISEGVLQERLSGKYDHEGTAWYADEVKQLCNLVDRLVGLIAEDDKTWTEFCFRFLGEVV